MNECCKSKDNWELVEEAEGKPAIFTSSTLDVLRSSRTKNQKFRCKVCNRNHYKLLVEPGHIGLALR